MKKLKFFLLFALTLIFALTLSVGTFSVFAEGTGNSNQQEEQAAEELKAYQDLFSGSSYTISKDSENGLKIAFNKDGAEATSKNYLSIGKDGEYFVSSAVVDVTDITSKELFYVRLVPSASSSSDTIHFFYSKTDNVKKVYVKFNNDTVEFELGNNFVSYKTEAEKEMLTIKDFTIEVINGEVFLNAYSETEKIGDSLNENPYAKIQVYAKTAFDFYLSEIYDLSGKKADFATGVSSFRYGVNYFVEDGTFFTRTSAVWGYQYDATITVYDFLDDVQATKVLKYTKVKDQNGSAVTEETKTSTNNAKITFGSAGTYEVVVEVTNNKNKVLKTYTIDVVSTSDNSSVSYFSYNEVKEEYDAIKKDIDEKIGTKATGSKINIGDNFYYPAVTEIINSKFFDVSTLKLTLYYASIANTDYVSTTNKYFEVSQVGKYRYFILPQDELGFGPTYDEDFKEKYEVKEDSNGNLGWCLKGTTEIVIPVFRFEIEDNSTPEITLGKESGAFIGKKYQVNSITINASNYDTDYELFFMSSGDYDAYKETKGFAFERSSFKDSLGNYDTKAYKAAFDDLKANNKLTLVPNLQDLTDKKDVTDAFDTTNKSFIPKKGHYYLVCTVHAENGMTDFVITDPISAYREPKNVEWEDESVKEFFVNNKQSIIYLSISVACCIGIILLLTIKPKKKEVTNYNEEV